MAHLLLGLMVGKREGTQRAHSGVGLMFMNIVYICNYA